MRPLRGFGDGKSIVAVVLIAFNEGLNVLGWDQPNVHAMPLKGASPVVGAAAGLHGDDGFWVFQEQRQQSLALHLPVKDRLASLIHGTDLEDGLCEINPDQGNVHVGTSCSRLVLVTQSWRIVTPYWQEVSISSSL